MGSQKYQKYRIHGGHRARWHDPSRIGNAVSHQFLAQEALAPNSTNPNITLLHASSPAIFSNSRNSRVGKQENIDMSTPELYTPEDPQDQSTCRGHLTVSCRGMRRMGVSGSLDRTSSSALYRPGAIPEPVHILTKYFLTQLTPAPSRLPAEVIKVQTYNIIQRLQPHKDQGHNSVALTVWKRGRTEDTHC